MLDASALWLQPGADHPVFKRYADLFGRLFSRFDVFDYRKAYLKFGGKELERSVLLTIDRCQPLILLYTQFPNSYAYLTPDFIAKVRQRLPVVGMGWDDEIYFDQAKYFYQVCSAVITTDMEGVKCLKQAGILAYVVVTAWLTHPSRTLRKEDIPVSFVGDMTKPGRREFIQHLEENGIAVADYGFGSRNGSLSHEDIADVFLRSKINLNFTSTNPPAWVLRHDPMRAHKRQVKGRPFELAALGRFCLSEWAPCVDYWFTPGVDIGVFRDMDDLVQKTRRYLKENEQRHDMATAAQKKFLKELAPEIQFSRVFSEILTTCRDKDPHLTELPNNTPIFYESMGRSRGISFLYALHRGAPLRAIQEIFMKWSWHITYWRGFIGIGLEIVMRKFGRT